MYVHNIFKPLQSGVKNPYGAQFQLFWYYKYETERKEKTSRDPN